MRGFQKPHCDLKSMSSIMHLWLLIQPNQLNNENGITNVHDSHCHILLNRIQLGENPAVSFCFDFYYIKLPQRLEVSFCLKQSAHKLEAAYLIQFISLISNFLVPVSLKQRSPNGGHFSFWVTFAPQTSVKKKSK